MVPKTANHLISGLFWSEHLQVYQIIFAAIYLLRR